MTAEELLGGKTQAAQAAGAYTGSLAPEWGGLICAVEHLPH